MGCNLLKHAYNHFSILMRHRIMIRYSITVLIDCHIDMYRRSLVGACVVYAHARACVCMYVDMFVYIYTQVTRVCQDLPHHMSGTFNKHSSLAIFDEHLVRQTNQRWPKILPQYPLETALTVT